VKQARTIVFVLLALLATPTAARAEEDDDPPLAVSATKAATSARSDAQAIEALRLEMKASREAFERQIAELRAKLDSQATESRSVVELIDHLRDHFSVGAYLQSQFETHQDSEDQLAQGGALLNRDRFSIRRGRARLNGDWEWVSLFLEIDGNTTSGPHLGLQHAVASVHAFEPGSDVPLFNLSLGLFDTPFGYELIESPRTRVFMERSTASRALFPTEPDVGVRVNGGLSFFRWSIALLNGQPIDSKLPYPGQSPIQAKDIVFRAGVDTHPRAELQIAGGVSVLNGKGFAPGSSAGKSVINWRDINENGSIDGITELEGSTGAAAVPSSTFSHWAVGGDLQLHYAWAPGMLEFFGELVVANNLDRGLYIADPVLLGTSTRELGFAVALTQQITDFGIAGIRYDYYDPNSDAFDKRQGRLFPYSLVVQTLSPVVGVVLPHRAKLLAQYDAIWNAFARDMHGVPTLLKDNVLTVRLQVEL
jgi:hypothetical protein